MRPVIARFFFTSVLSAGLFAASAQCSSAGTTGILLGSVIDESGAGIADETVTVTAPSATVTVHADAKGRYCFLSLPPDVYTVWAQRAGFETTSATEVHVSSDQLLIIDLVTAKR